jgi:hypothetical protein
VTTQTDLPDFAPPCSTSPRPRGRGCVPVHTSRAGLRGRPGGWPGLCAAMVCTGALWNTPAQATRPKPARAASTPSTAQVLAPSAATVPDALPTERTIYRCGNSYSARPCGDAAPLDVADARSEAQRRQAEDVATRDKRLASWLEAGRRDRERGASAPMPARAARASTACVETAAIACVPKKPRPRHAVAKVPKAASAAANGKS